MHLRQPGFTYSVCEPFSKKKERIQKFLEPGDSRFIYQKELGKAWFQHVMAYGDFKYLTERTASNKTWVMKPLILLKIRNMMDINVELLQWSLNVLIK